MLTLAPHIQCCLVDDHLLLLDLKRGRYTGLSGSIAERLRGKVSGIPSAPTAARERIDPCAADGPSDEEVIQEMCSAGLIVRQSAAAGEGAREMRVEHPNRSLIHGYEWIPVSISMRHVLNFFLSCAIAWTSLRWRSMEALARRLEKHSLKVSLTTPDRPQMRDLVVIFNRLRPFVYTSHDACLFNSLAMQEFLRRYGLRAQFVIGVTARPFKAHCWLQSGSTVINDTADEVWHYTPILAK